MSNVDRITELKNEINRMRDNERNNVRLLKLLHSDLIAMDEQSGGQCFSTLLMKDEPSSCALIVMVGDAPMITVTVMAGNSDFCLATVSGAREYLAFSDMWIALRDRLAEDLYLMEKDRNAMASAAFAARMAAENAAT